MVSEPTAFLTHALCTSANSAEADLILEKPSPFTLTPADITEEAIGSLVTKYEATDVLPPPEDYVSVSDQATAGGGDANTHYDHGALLTIPSGTSGKSIRRRSMSWSDPETYRFSADGNWTWRTGITNQLG